MRTDIVVVGAGPAGLAFARGLSGTGLQVTLVEKSSIETLANPAFDGREIALTQGSVRRMRELGFWCGLAPDEIFPIRNARVLNSDSPFELTLSPVHGHDELGFLVPNHAIRRTAYTAVAANAEVRILAGRNVVGVDNSSGGAAVLLDDGTRITSRLVVAADTRFSTTRRAVGIAAEMFDFGRSMLVCRMSHGNDNHGTAWEWFGRGQTLAVLPLGPNEASIVVTLSHGTIEALMSMDEAAFAREITDRFDGGLGSMRLTSTRHAYPLVAVYAKRFVQTGFACIGDAAVGMHPVTAHGYNLGLLGACSLAASIASAVRAGSNPFAAALLTRWEQNHRHATRPLFLATNAIARLYADESLPAQALRNLALAFVQRVPPLRKSLAMVVADRERPAA